MEEASWIGERLAPFDAYRVTSFVPRGFAAYARVLHPAWTYLGGPAGLIERLLADRRLEVLPPGPMIPSRGPRTG